MSFKNLEERFNATVNDLYAGAKTKFEDGRPSNGANDDPLIVRKPGDGYFNGVARTLGRSLPIISALQDTKRVTLFTVSTRGIAFLLKQQLLQTGNTFEQTRLINPVFAIAAAAAPGLGNIVRIRRHLLGNPLLGKTDTSDANVRKLGQLQKGTYEGLKVPGAQVSGSIFKSLAGPLTNTVSAINAPKNIGEELEWEQSRPELFQQIPDDQNKLLEFQQKTADEQTLESATGTYGVKFIKYFAAGRDTIAGGEPGSTYPASFIAKRNSEGGQLPAEGKISYIRDPLNDPAIPGVKGGRANGTSTLAAYNKLTTIGNGAKGSIDLATAVDDPIVVSFAMGNQSHVQFRAFIKDLQQSATPQYKDYQYIGRIEKFISYISVQREVSFKLGLVAFSQEELDIVWTRINYLTGMVFPFGITKGILQPNLIRMTVGRVYVDQPAYITALSTTFNDHTETWDIGFDKQVPIGATMDMKFNIIEKRTALADTPFYGITEGIGGFAPLPVTSDPVATTPLDINAAIAIDPTVISGLTLQAPVVPPPPNVTLPQNLTLGDTRGVPQPPSTQNEQARPRALLTNPVTDRIGRF